MRYTQVLALCAMIFLAGCATGNSTANSQGFRFEDYGRGRYIGDLNTYFPKGTPREDVEKIFVGEGGAWIIPLTKPGLTSATRNERVLYRYDDAGAILTNGYIIYAAYDAQGKLQDVRATSEHVPAGRVDPKVTPEKFNLAAWLIFGSGEDELTYILGNDFPVGSVRGDIEKYLLASHQLETKTGESILRGPA